MGKMMFLDEDQHKGTAKKNETDEDVKQKANELYEQINEERLKIKGMRDT